MSYLFLWLNIAISCRYTNHKNYGNYSPVNKAPPLFDHQVEVFVTSFISPCLYTKNCIISKNICANIDEETFFCSQDCLSYLALSVKIPQPKHRNNFKKFVDNGDGTRVLDRATRPIQLKVKEALHIKSTPANTRFNRDRGYELPGCWIAKNIAIMKKLGGGANRAGIKHTSASTSTSAPNSMGTQEQKPRI